MRISVSEIAAGSSRKPNETASLRSQSRTMDNSEQAEERQRESSELTPEMVKALADAGNTIAQAFKIEIRFETHDETDLRKMTIVDPDSGAVIREIPPDAILDMIGKMWEKIGLIIDQKA